MTERLLPVACSMALVLGLAAGAAGQGNPVSVDVDCDAGQTIAAALQKTAAASWVIVNVSGTCRESVTIQRDDIRLAGRPGDAIWADTTQAYALSVENRHRVSASGLTLRGGYSAALVVVNAVFDGDGLAIAEGNAGVRLQRGADVSLYDCRIEGSRYEGILAVDSSVSLLKCSLSKNRTYGIWAQHSRAALQNVDVEGSMVGLAADALSVISTAGQYLRVHDNQLGVRLRLNSVGWHGGALPTVSQNVTDFSIDASSIW